jgi:hypothetical protein
VGSKPLYLQNAILEDNSSYKPVPVSHDVENHTVITNNTDIRILHPQFIEVPTRRLEHFGIPAKQSRGRQWMPLSISQQRSTSNNVEHGKGKCFLLENLDF